MTTMSTALHDSEEYYCFRVQESIGCELGDDENIVIPCSSNFDLEKLRTELWKQFGVPRDRRISYIDDDGDNVLIDLECEFQEALKLAKNAFIANKSIPLIVGSFHVPTCSDDEQCLKTNEICSKESRSVNSNLVPELNLELDEQKHLAYNTPNQIKKNIKCNESNEKQAELEDTNVPKEFNTNLRCNSDTVAPLWFTEYMEVMKKDMISMITNEVIRNVTEVMNKRLDSFLHPLKQLGQSRSQSYSSLSKRHSRCSSDSNEKTQKRMRSQDEEQSSDTSIERVDEPQHTSTAEDPQKTRGMITTISQEVVKEMTEILNKYPKESLCQSHFPSLKRLPRYTESQLSGKNQKKMDLQDGELSSDDALMEHTYKPRNRSLSNIADVTRQKKRDIIADFKRHGRAFQEVQKEKWIAHVVDNISIDYDNDKKQSTQNNIPEDVLFWKQFDSACDKIPETIENELRMSCSITGHQLLDKGRNKDTSNNSSDIDKTSFWLCDEEDDDAFEIVQMPPANSSITNELCCEELATEQRRHDSNRDSPSFEILSEPSSPMCRVHPMHFNDHHFSLNEKNGEQQSSRFVGTNSPIGSIFMVDVNDKIYNENKSKDADEPISSDLEKRSGGAYSFVAETLPVQDSCYSKSCSEQRLSGRQKNPRDDVSGNASSKYDDVRNSHTSYLNVRIDCDSKMQCSCQSQTDLNDFTQSFHSHTTSVTDTTDIYTEAYDNNKYNERVPTIDEQKSARVTVTETTPKNDHDACGSGGCSKESKTSETQRCYGGCTEESKTSGRQNYNGSDNFPKRFCGSHSSPRGSSVDPPHQSDRSSSNGSKKPADDIIPDIDPLRHIIPDTLFDAITVVNYYCDTACKVLDKMRTHKRQGKVQR